MSIPLSATGQPNIDPLTKATMYNRRGLLRMGACACGYLAMRAAPAQATSNRYHCALYSRSGAGDRTVSDTQPLANMDQLVARYLAADQFKLEQLFEVKGQLLGSTVEDGAYSILFDGADPLLDGKVVFGKSFIDGVKDQKYGLLRLSVILAHEYSHLYQFKSGDFDYLFDGCGRKGDRPHLLPELHADFLSGVFMGWRGQVTPEAQNLLSDYFYTLGDVTFLKDHHGIPVDRKAAFVAGFKIGTEAVSGGTMKMSLISSEGKILLEKGKACETGKTLLNVKI